MKMLALLLVTSFVVCVAGKKSLTFQNDSGEPLIKLLIKKCADNSVCFEGPLEIDEQKKIEFELTKTQFETSLKFIIQSRVKNSYEAYMKASSLLTQFHWDGAQITVAKPFEYFLDLIEQPGPSFGPEDPAQYDKEGNSHNNRLPEKWHPEGTIGPFVDQSLYDGESE